MNATLSGLAAGCAAIVLASSAFAQTAPPLGSAQSFAVLGGSTVTNTGTTTITGDLGASPGSAITGFPPGVVMSGGIHAADALALGAQDSLTIAYNNVAAQPCTADLTGQDLGGMTLTPGVYCFSTSAFLTGTLTLNAQGNPNAVFILKTGSTLVTASGSSVVLANGAASCNVFWQVGSSATLGSGSSFAGSILALTSITATSGANVSGRLLARNGAVTLDTNGVSAALCAVLCPAIGLSPPTLPNGTVGTVYNQTITGSGGAAPYTFAVVSGTLPAGLTLTSAGVISGTPTTASTSTVTIRGTDANGCIADITLTIVITAGCPVITLSPATLPNGSVGAVYSQTITGSGGAAPYTFAVVSGVLPAGLTLTAAGVISGTPTTASTSTVTIRGTDANGCFANLTLTILITAAQPPGCPVVTLSPTTLPNGTVAVAYSQTIVGVGGTAPYIFTVTTGTLPAGLTLTPAGVLAGTPTTAGPSTMTIRGTDANGCFAEVPYSMTVVTAVPTLPQLFVILLALGLMALGYLRLRNRASVR